jgi:hypothetical protein
MECVVIVSSTRISNLFIQQMEEHFHFFELSVSWNVLVFDITSLCSNRQVDC